MNTFLLSNIRVIEMSSIIIFWRPCIPSALDLSVNVRSKVTLCCLAWKGDRDFYLVCFHYRNMHDVLSEEMVGYLDQVLTRQLTPLVMLAHRKHSLLFSSHCIGFLLLFYLIQSMMIFQ